MVGGEGGEGTAPDSYEGSIFGSTGWEYYVHHADDELNVRVPIRAGTRIVGVSFASETWEARVSSNHDSLDSRWPATP